MSKVEADDCAMIGQVIDNRYRIVSKLGEGGMGEVYAAEHVHIQKRVAIKLLRTEVTSNQEAVSRFQQEARSASQIGHQNIISIEDAGKLEDGRFYLCMELLDGEPLNDILKAGPLPHDRALDILIKSCHGLAAAHKKGIVHRDMKPENVFVTTGSDGKDVPKLLDFGIAKVSGADGDNNLTRTGTIFGTPYYMAPEQALGQGIDHRADVYAIGVIMYEIFAGSVPFQGESFMGILTKHITAEPEPPSQRAVKEGRHLPQGVEPIIARAMKKEADERFQSMDELVSALIGLHRRVVGPGMSGYMAAHLPPASAMGLPNMSGVPSGAVPMRGHTPSSGIMPEAHERPSGSVPMAPPQQYSGAMAAAPYSGAYPASASSSMVGMPKKGGKAGLIAAVIAVIAVIGGTVGFLLLPSGGDKANSGIESTDKPDPDPTKTPDTKPGGTTADTKKPDPDPGNGNTDKPDSTEGGPGNNTTNDPDNTTVVPPPEVKPVVVTIKSKPKKAWVRRDGVVLGMTPLKVQVVPGEEVAFTLGKNRYKEASITLDGSETKISVKLDKRPKGSSNGGKPDPTKNGGNPDPGKDGKDGKDDKDGKDGKAGTLKLPLQ